MFKSSLPKVLVVDDDPLMLDFLQLAITPEASQVGIAENAASRVASH